MVGGPCWSILYAVDFDALKGGTDTQVSFVIELIILHING